MNKITEAAEQWLNSAQYDFESAEIMQKTGRYLYVAFMCHLATEKALKATIANTGVFPPRIHNLLRLAELSPIYERFNAQRVKFLDNLTPMHIEARYLDYKNSIAQRLSSEVCSKILEETRECLAWIKKQL